MNLLNMNNLLEKLNARAQRRSDTFSNMPSGVNRILSNISERISRKQKQNVESTTNTISSPFDFRHVKHVGMDINDCKIVNPELKAFFDKVGITESHLEHQETRDFIYNFIESHGGIDAVMKEIAPSPSPSPTNVQISLPFDFRHVSHVGLRRFEMIPELKAFFDKVGITESHLEHQETRDFIYDFIESHGGIDAIKKEIQKEEPIV